MDEFEIKAHSFDRGEIDALQENKEQNWPVVYHIQKGNDVYIGETTNFKNRMLQHLNSSKNDKLNGGVVHVIVDKEFNKSATLDLESFLIQSFSGINDISLLNGNEGLADHNYYRRSHYLEKFIRIWDQLYNKKIATKTLNSIRNDALYKYSPYKALNNQQEEVIREILLNIDKSIAEKRKSISVVSGDAGTGKTIVIMYMAKLIADLQAFSGEIDDIDENSSYKDFFEKKFINRRFKRTKVALVIPQESLRSRIQKIARKMVSKDSNIQVFSPITFAKCKDDFDITLIDEGHLLKVGFTGNTGKDAKAINQLLFGDNKVHTEFDWIAKKSKNIVIVFSEDQRIKPANIVLNDIKKYSDCWDYYDGYKLEKQMRSLGSIEYIQYINDIFSNSERKPKRQIFDGFEMRLFEFLPKMYSEIRKRNVEVGLSRMVAGFAWDWSSNPQKATAASYDMVIDGMKLKWNSTRNNWIGREESINEIGSIYTVQGEDLNYIGVIIGKDLIYRNGKLIFNKKSYADSGALKRSQRQVAEEEELDDNYFLEQVLRIYRVLMNRAVMGVYVYACDKELSQYLSKFFSKMRVIKKVNTNNNFISPVDVVSSHKK